jgi:RNA polymerase sigma-70 factor (sigma-E family)
VDVTVNEIDADDIVDTKERSEQRPAAAAATEETAEPAGVEVPEPSDFEDYAAARQHSLYRTAYLLCGDRDRAQDLVQTTLVALLRSWKKARLAQNPDAYAKKALVRAFLREQSILRRSASAHAFLQAGAERSAAPEPNELRVIVVDALRSLPPKARAMVILRYWEDLSVEETAVLLGCSEGNVKSQCSRSLAKLRSLLGDRFTDPTV